MYVTPTPGLRIPDPDLRDYLPVEGREVPDTPYWHRRVNDQDVALARPVPEKQNNPERSTKE